MKQAATKLAPFLREIVFVGGVTLGLLVTDEYLAEAARSLLDESDFLDVLPGFVLDEGRVPLMMERLSGLAKLNA